MTSQHDKAKRRWPRWSIRSLLMAVTLVGAYFGFWEVTKEYAVIHRDPVPFAHHPDGSVEYLDWSETSPAPFIVRGQEEVAIGDFAGYRTVYFLWLLGPRIRLTPE